MVGTGATRLASVWLAPDERVVRCAQAAGETMPAVLSEGVFGKDVAIAVVYVVRMREREGRGGDDGL